MFFTLYLVELEFLMLIEFGKLLELNFYKHLWSRQKHSLYNYLNHLRTIHYFTDCINYMYDNNTVYQEFLYVCFGLIMIDEGDYRISTTKFFFLGKIETSGLL